MTNEQPDKATDAPAPEATSEYDIRTVAALRAVIGAEVPGLADKNLAKLDSYGRDFIAKSPFIVLATSDAQGNLDASPKGDAPGFVHVEDEVTLLIPDRPGNKLAYGHLNVIENPRVGLIFMIPGTPETLRINGDATLTSDPVLLEKLAARGKSATLVMRVRVREMFFHCAKAFMRSGLWQPDQWPARHRVSFGEMFAAQRNEPEATAQVIDQFVQDDYDNNL